MAQKPQLLTTSRKRTSVKQLRRKRNSLRLETLERRDLLAVLTWDGGGNDGGNWSNPANWDEGGSDPGAAPGAADTAIFADAAVGTVNLDVPVTVSALQFTNGAGSFVLEGTATNTLTISNSLTQTGSGDNRINAQLADSAADISINVSAGQLQLQNTGNELDAADTVTVSSNATVLSAVGGPNRGIGGATVDLNDGNLNFVLGTGAVVRVNALEETIFDASRSADETRNNIEAFRNTSLGSNDASGLLTTHLDYFDDAAVSARAAALGAVGFNNENFAMLWVTTFTPDQDGSWGFQFALSDDDASIWIDLDRNGTFEASDRIFASTGCCNPSGEQFTPNLTDGTSYLLGIVLNDTGGGGYLRNMQFMSPAVGAWAPLNPSINDGLFTVEQLAQGTGSNNINVTGNSVINTGDVSSLSFGDLNIADGAALAVNRGSFSGRPDVDFTGTTTFAGAATLNTGDNVDLTLSGVVTGPGALSKLGNGTLILSNSGNSYQGSTTVNAGVLRVEADGALGFTGAGTTVSDGAQLKLRTNYNAAETLTLNGVGLNGDGALESSEGNWAYNGPVVVASQTFIVASTAGQSLTLGGGVDTGSSLTQFGGNGNIVVNSVISGTGNILKTQGGNLTFNNANTYSGTTQVDEGRLIITNGDALGATTAGTTINGNGQLRLQNNVSVNPAEVVAINGNGFNGEGALRNESGDNSISNVVVASAARITSNSGTLLLPQGLDAAQPVTFAGNGTTNISGVLSGAANLSKVDDGTLVLTNSGNTFSSLLSISNGRVRVTTDGALGAVSGATIATGGGTLEFDGSFDYTTLEPIFLSGPGESNSGALSSINGNTQIAVDINVVASATIGSNSAGSKLTLAGQLILAGNATVTFTGAGDIDIVQSFGNGNGLASGLGLDARLLNNQTGLGINNDAGIASALAATPTAQTTLVGPLNFPQDSDGLFTNFFGGGLPGGNNFTAIFSGQFTPTASGDHSFAITQNDDTAVLWIDLDRDGVFETGNNELIRNVGCCNNPDSSTVNLVADGTPYSVVFAVEDTGGGSGLVGRFQDPPPPFPSALQLAIVDPLGQPGRWTNQSQADNNVIKTGSGTTTFLAGNTYNGVTTVSQGVLVVAANNGLGTADGGTNVLNGGTLLLTNSANVGAEELQLTGNGATGQAGALVNQSGNGFVGGDVRIGSTVTVNEATIASLAGELTLDGSVDFGFAALNVTGDGIVRINGDVTGNGGDGFVGGGLNGDYYTIGANLNLLEPTADGSDAPDRINLETATPNAALYTPRVDFGTGTESVPGDGSVLDRGETGGNPFGGIGINVGTDNIAGRWTGFIFIPEDANYQFAMRSDDGSRLWLDTDGDNVLELIVDNNRNGGMGDGNSGPTPPAGQTNVNGTKISANRFLTSGYYPIRIAGFEGGGGSGYQASWSQVDGANPFSRRIIEPAALTLPISSNNEINKSGNGTLILNGNITLAGDVNINSGSLTGNGNITSTVDVATGALISAGDGLNTVGTLTVNNINLASLSTAYGDIDSGGGDQLVVNGTITMQPNAIADAQLLNGFVPPAGSTYILIDNNGGTPLGEFAQIPNQPGGFQTDIDGRRVTIFYSFAGNNDLAVVFNNAPIAAQDGPFFTDEDVTLNSAPFSLLTNDTDAEGDTLTAVIVQDVPAGHSLTLNPDGTFVYVPLTDFSGSVTFQYAAFDGEWQSSPITVTINVAGVADVPTLTVADAAGLEDTPIDLAISGSVSAGETLSFLVSNVPAGATLSAGTPTGIAGQFLLTEAEAVGLTITPPLHSDVDFTLSVIAIATQGAASAQSLPQLLNVTVTAVADMPTLGVQNVFGNEGTPIDLNIQAALVDTDGSETLSVTVSNVPSTPTGSGLTFGSSTPGPTASLVDQGGGVWLITGTSADIALVKILKGDNDTIVLDVVATATESDPNASPQTAASSDVMQVVVSNVAPTPTLDDVIILGNPLGAVDEVTVVPGLAITFVVSTTDLAFPNTQDAPFTFTIDFGDGIGVLTDVTSAELEQLEFTYEYQTYGTYEVSLTVTDKDGGSTTVSPLTTVNVSKITTIDGIAFVGGTINADRIIVSTPSRGGVQVRMNGAILAHQPDAYKVVVFGNRGADTITVSGSFIPVEFYGGEGNDYLAGGRSSDLLDGGEGNDRLLGSDGDDILLGGSGHDRFSGGNGNDFLAGDMQVDEELGEPIFFEFFDREVPLREADSPGNDLLNGDNGNDTLIGGEGNDTLNGGTGHDLLLGGEGSDRMNGGSGNDFLWGGNGGDFVAGGQGRDVLLSGAGIDTLKGGNSGDLLYASDLDEFLLDFRDTSWIDELWSLWQLGFEDDAAQMVINEAMDDGFHDTLHGEIDDDWYILFEDDRLQVSTERGNGNVIFREGIDF